MRRVAWVAGAAACLIGLSAHAAVLEEFSVEDWSGFALADDRTGRLASCAVYSRYQNGATLFFVKHAEGGWVMSLVHASWALTQDSSHPVRYRVDREPYVEASGIALDIDQIGLAVPDDDPLIEAVRRGSLLNVQFQGREFGFDLANSGKALKAAVDCTERNRDKVAPQVAGESGSMPPETPDAAAAENADPVASAKTGAPASADPAPSPGRQSFGPWVVAATHDASGRFLNCTAFGVHGTDQLILSYFPDETWDFSLYRGGWALDTGRSYVLSYNIDAPVDAPGTVKRPVEAVEAGRILMELDRGDDLIGRIEQGRELELRLGGGSEAPEELQYSLDRAAEALAAARQCTARSRPGT